MTSAFLHFLTCFSLTPNSRSRRIIFSFRKINKFCLECTIISHSFWLFSWHSKHNVSTCLENTCFQLFYFKVQYWVKVISIYWLANHGLLFPALLHCTCFIWSSFKSYFFNFLTHTGTSIVLPLHGKLFKTSRSAFYADIKNISWFQLNIRDL